MTVYSRLKQAGTRCRPKQPVAHPQQPQQPDQQHVPHEKHLHGPVSSHAKRRHAKPSKNDRHHHSMMPRHPVQEIIMLNYFYGIIMMKIKNHYFK